MTPLKPAAQATVNINVSSSNQRVQYSTDTAPQSVRIYNDGTATVWVTYGDNTCVASTSTSYPIAAGADMVLTYTGGYVAAIAAGSTGKIYFTPGDGF